MWKKMLCLATLIVVLGLTGSASAELFAYWKMDDGAGTTALDSTGNGYDGTLTGDATWATGQLGGALQLDGNGDYVSCGLMDIDTTVTGGVSVCAWINKPAGGDMKLCGNNQGENAAGGGFKCAIYNNRMEMDIQNTAGRNLNRDTDGPEIPGNTWIHLAWVFDDVANLFIEYHNGVVVDSSAENQSVGLSTMEFRIGTNSPPLSHYFNGMVDDLRVYNHAITEAEVADAMAGRGADSELASDPIPATEAVDVLRNVVLEWAPGEFAGTHHVYVGTSLEEVGNATVPTASGLTVTSFDPGRLDFGQTYFWRVDEVNATLDKTVFPGSVWSFTVEPYSIMIPVDAGKATASSFSGKNTPDMTVNGSGLTGNTHATDNEQMWLSAPADLSPWLMYEFDQIEKLDQMLIWNSNSSSEGFVGWGIKDVTIETSTDGVAWAVLADATQISRAPGLATYDSPQAIDLGLALAKYVRINIQNNWGGLLKQYGVSEVQFYGLPVIARTPNPASGSVDVRPDTVATWRAGHEAVQHTIYVSDDANAVADGTAASILSATNSASLKPLDLQMSQTYYWRVDEVNDAETPSVWTGPVWSLSTADALIVDDFESYGNKSPNRPFQTWTDGYGYSGDDYFPEYAGNGTGAGIGHDIWAPSSPYFNGSIMETDSTMAGSSQSMPFYYNNTGGVASKTERQFAEPQDWTVGGAKVLSIAFAGQGGNTGTLYAMINNTKIVYSAADPLFSGIGRSLWQTWNIDLASVSGLKNVTKLTIGVEGSGASGMILIDDIRLVAEATEDVISNDVTTPGDELRGVPDDGDWPAAESPDLAIDNNVNTKFLHRKGGAIPTGIQVTPQMGSTVVTGLTLTTANDTPTRDPITYELSGSNTSIDGPYEVIASGNVVDFAGATEWPRFTPNSTPIEFANTKAYKHYQLLFPTLRGAAEALMQIAEVELIMAK